MESALAGVLILAAAGGAAAQQPVDLSGKTVEQLLQLMDDNSFSVRQDATAELEKRLPKLTKDDLAKCVAAYFDASLEVQHRLDRLLKEYLVDLGNSPKATAAMGLMEVRFTKYDERKDLNAKIKFGDFAGEVPVNVHGKEAEWKVYLELKARWAAYRNYIRIGDTDGATARLDEMKTFIKGLDKFQFSYLNLTNSDGKPVTKDDVLEAIAAAKLLTKQAKQEIQKKMGMVPDPRRMIPVAGAGPLNMGQTVALNIGNVLEPGNLDVSWSDMQLDYGPAPVGHTVVGPLYDMQADSNLLIAGTVSISIQYGGSEGNAYGISDPSQLANRTDRRRWLSVPRRLQRFGQSHHHGCLPDR